MPQNLFGTNQTLDNDPKNAPFFGVLLILETIQAKTNCSRVFIWEIFQLWGKNEYFCI